MDVITILQPENHISRQGFPLSGRINSRPKAPRENRAIRENRASRARVQERQIFHDTAFGVSGNSAFFSFSFAGFREMPGPLSLPFLLLLVVTLSLAMTPALQQRFGFYRLDGISMPSDAGAETAMRLLVTPEPDASLLAGTGTSELPSTIQAVRYSEYTVKTGDTAGAILSRSGLKNLGTILSVNKIDNARRIRTGQVLRVPSMDGVLYTVARGDSLSGIAAHYSVPVNAILDANDLSRSTLSSGQVLFVPGASLTSMELRRALGELFIFPLQGRLTSPFGFRSDPFTGARTFHTGIDLASPVGTPVKAILDGRIAVTGFSPVFGNYIIITHDAGFQSLYGHLSYIGVSRGALVTQGMIIGKVGTTGYSTGPHLHLSIYKYGKMIDPLSVLK
jgi:murein DD-endopeptidase MepM/ murein hydrolase activator NlpD